MKSSVVSIIIPCYNAERWVAEAIQSALNQSWPNKEVIVIDDGSTDRSLDVIKSFGDKIRWETSPNRGGCAARNRGLELASGEFIQFLDADDLLTPDCVQAKMNHPQEPHTIICSGVECLKGFKGEVVWFWNQLEYSLEYMLRNGTPQTAAPLHTLSRLLSIGGFREGLPCAQEYDLHLRLAILHGMKFVTIEHVGVLIRPLSESVSRSSGYKWSLAIFDILRRSAQQIENNGKATPENKSAIAQQITTVARPLWRAGRIKEARCMAKFAKSLSPEWSVGCYNGRLANIAASTIGFCNFELLRWIYIKAMQVIGYKKSAKGETL